MMKVTSQPVVPSVGWFHCADVYWKPAKKLITAGQKHVCIKVDRSRNASCLMMMMVDQWTHSIYVKAAEAEMSPWNRSEAEQRWAGVALVIDPRLMLFVSTREGNGANESRLAVDVIGARKRWGHGEAACQSSKRRSSIPWPTASWESDLITQSASVLLRRACVVGVIVSSRALGSRSDVSASLRLSCTCSSSRAAQHEPQIRIIHL